MKKLEDIPKKQIFTVADDYFEKLPGVIQSRVANPERKPVLFYALQFGLPAIAVVIITFFWLFPQGNDTSVEGILSSIETEQLVAYLSETDMTTEELLDDVVLDNLDAEQIEEAVYDLNLGEVDLENIQDDYDL